MSKKNRIAKQLKNIDAMSGLDFEKFVAKLLQEQHYKTTNIRASGDFGVDVIAEKANIKYAVQVKRYKGSVSRTAISDAVAGKYHWKCDKAWVFTNSYFTADAKTLAKSTKCKLTDRDDLTNILYQQKQKDKENPKRVFVNFILFILFFITLGLFIIKQSNPKAWSYIQKNILTPIVNIAKEISSGSTKTNNPNENILETKKPTNPEPNDPEPNDEIFILTPKKENSVPVEQNKDGVTILKPIK